DIPVLLTTVTWRLAAASFARRFGFGGFCGTEMGEADGCLTGVVTRHCSADDKLGFVRDWCAARGIALADCAAVGDSRSDVPLFGAVGLAIALNATPDAI